MNDKQTYNEQVLLHLMYRLDNPKVKKNSNVTTIEKDLQLSKLHKTFFFKFWIKLKNRKAALTHPNLFYVNLWQAIASFPSDVLYKELTEKLSLLKRKYGRL